MRKKTKNKAHIDRIVLFIILLLLFFTLMMKIYLLFSPLYWTELFHKRKNNINHIWILKDRAFAPSNLVPMFITVSSQIGFVKDDWATN